MKTKIVSTTTSIDTHLSSHDVSCECNEISNTFSCSQNIDKRLSKYTVGHTNISSMIGYVYIVFFKPSLAFLTFLSNPLKHVVPL